jgi:hypothetical protein
VIVHDNLQQIADNCAERARLSKRRPGRLALLLRAVGTTWLLGAYFLGRQLQAAEPVPASPAKTDRPLTLAEAQLEKDYHASKLDLTPESFGKFRDLIRPQEKEWRHIQVHWHTDLIAALKKAAKEDKPLLTLWTKGAGYNDPLGVC